ncbi:uncharacterized protein [Erythrolamprus reginae]|uniref:uncharacterized protein n=1 Tax=Erythrolamprus reginae TaxID=121349 RepID=UPI00396C9F24
MSKFTFFLKASNLHDADDERKKAIFLAYCGTEVYSLASTLVDPDTLETIAWSALQAKLAAHYQPTTPVRVYRHQFAQMRQADGESTNDFITRLRALLPKCKYKDPEEQLIDRLIFGLTNITLQKKYLVDEAASLQDILKAAKASEVSETSVAEIKRATPTVHHIPDESTWLACPPDEKHSESTTPDDTCLQIRRAPDHDARETPRSDRCAGCNGNHPRFRCHFKDAYCCRCQCRGHIAEVCRAANPTPANPQNQRPYFPPRNRRPPFSRNVSRPADNSNSSNQRENLEKIADIFLLCKRRRRPSQDSSFFCSQMFACRNLYRLQHKYPIMQQTVDQIMTNAIESIYTKLTEVKDIMDTMLDISIEAAAESMELTLCSARSAVDTIMDIDMAQMMASSVDKIIFKSDDLLEHFLPITDEEFFAIAFSDRSGAASLENQEGEPSYYRRLSSLSMKLCSRAYQHSRIKIKLGAEQVLLQLEQLFYLLKYTKEELDYKVHRGHEKMYQMWKEWYKGEPKQDQSNGANQTEMESHSLATSYTVAQKMQEVCQNVLTNLQSLPEHLQQKVQQAQCDLTEVQAVLSTATSFQDLPSGFMKETTEKINKARKALFEVMEYIAKYTCQPWVEGPYCPAEYSAEESIKHNNVY